MAFSLVSTDTILARNAGALYGLALGSTNFTKYVEWMGTQPDDLLNFVYSNSVGATSTATVADVLISSLGITGVEAIAVAKAYIVSQLDAVEVADRGAVVDDILGMFSNLTNDAVFGPFAAAWNSRIAYAVNYGNQDGTPDSHFTASSVGTFTLTTGVDTIYATDGHDTFAANVVQNTGGYQVNTLGSGDYLDGGAGTDTLNAKITNGAFAGGSVSMPIQPETNSIEIVKLEAVLSDVRSFSDFIEATEQVPYISAADQVYVNAKDMEGVEQLWSNHSDADLTIMNLTTKGLEQLSDMTIGMAYTGNADSHWGASDYKVYFDQDYLTPEATRTNPSVEFLAMNEDNYDATEGQAPLDGVFFRVLNFTLNGETFELAPYLGEDVNGTGSEIKNYNEFLTHVQDALVQLKAEHPENAALQSVTATIGDQFETDVNPITLEVRVGTAVRLSVDGLTGGVENTLEVKSTDLEVVRALNATVPNNNRYELAEIFQPEEGDRIAINVALEKVGLAGDGGELVIGSMNKTADNEWDAKNTTVDSTTSGIEEFNVTVYGDASKSSSLSGLHSTNNNLRVVTVETDAAVTGTNGYADLTIGNSNTDMYGFEGYENALKDVQTFDASAFKGDLTVFAALTDEITDKYLNLVDEAPAAPAADNVNFEYTGGTGNDSFNVTISANNDEFWGAVTREDFTMNATIAGGAGDDEITLAIVDNDYNSGLDRQDSDGLAYASYGPFSDEDVLANWYDNQKLNANLRIDGGEGNDTLRKPGSGDVIINGGSGNDTVYADNTGRKADWIFNAAIGADPIRLDIDNIQSDANDSYRLFKTDVVVNFKGFEVRSAVVDRQGVATDLDINQAIKRAINSDAVLSKLLEAHDGPGNTLVIHSLIDGEMVGDQLFGGDDIGDLLVTLEPPLASELTAGDLNSLSNWYGTPGLTAAAVVTLVTGEAATFADKYDQWLAYDNGDELVGSRSLHTSDNTITGGTGDDVLVLGTGRMSNDTVVYEGFGNGTDTIVNFSTDNIGDNEVVMVGESEDTFESFTVTFSALTATAAGATMTVLGTPINLFGTGTPVAGVIPAVDIAYLVSQATVPGWTMTWDEGTASVDFVRNIPGNFDVYAGTAGDQDVTAANFVVGGGATGGAVTISNYVDGTLAFVEAEPASFDIDLNGSAANADGTFTFAYDRDGAGPGAVTEVNIDYKAGDGAITLSNKFAAALNAGSDWVATANDDGTVSVEAAVPGELDLNTYVYGPTADAITTAETKGLVIGISTYEDGANQVGTEGTWVTIESMPLDYLDFSDYNAVGVVVDGLVFHDVAALGENYVRFTENADNLGEYTVEVFTEAGATDTLVGTVGVLDFGATQNFVTENFII